MVKDEPGGTVRRKWNYQPDGGMAEKIQEDGWKKKRKNNDEIETNSARK